MLPCINVKHVVRRWSVIADKMNLDLSVDLSSRLSIKNVASYDETSIHDRLKSMLLNALISSLVKCLGPQIL